MYNILLVAKKENDYGSLYKYLTTENSQGQIIPVDIDGDAALDEYVEDMLNNKGYGKSDFIVITKKDYAVSTDIN